MGRGEGGCNGQRRAQKPPRERDRGRGGGRAGRRGEGNGPPHDRRAITTPYLSALVSRKLADAHTAGIACIAPAGGPVAFPAALPTVFAAGALGAHGTSPRHLPRHPHRTAIDTRRTLRRTVHLPRTWHRRRPRRRHPVLRAARRLRGLDGTTTASAHVADLAVLVLADHEDFHGATDTARTGHGLPDALTALGPPNTTHPHPRSPPMTR